MQNGISLYPGLDNSPEENLALLETAASLGITRLFTSLQVPEADPVRLKKECVTLLKAARAHHMEIISDVSPRTLEVLGIPKGRLSPFKMLGIGTLRLDYGFGLEEIARLSHNPQHIRLQLNASTMTGHMLQQLIELKCDFSQIDALHNFYPRPHTGLSVPTLARKTAMLHKAGIRVGAFVTTQQGKKRGPLGLGLPTLEDHRGFSVSLAARHLVALGIDSVFLADSLPSEAEIAALAHLKGSEVVLEAELLAHGESAQQLLHQTFTARIDEARDAIRAQESRTLLTAPIAPENTSARPAGSVTIDSERGGRYQGELEIIKNDLPADARVNVAARILPADQFLIPYIQPGRKFSFQFLGEK